MIERLKLKVFIEIQAREEKNLEGEGIVLIPRDTAAREISEAMLIDGALPSEINRVFLEGSSESAEEEAAREEAERIRKLNIVREQLILEGADEATINQLLSDMEKEAALARKNRGNSSLLSSCQPSIRVDLDTYRES